MVIAAPELSPLFRSDAQGEILAKLLLNSGQSFTIAELSRASGLAYASTHREVERLLRTQVVRETRVGLHRQVTANDASPAVAPLQELLLQSYGPVAVLPQALRGLDGVAEAYIYGSWAARRAGEHGSPPQDVDLLIIGDPPRDRLYDICEEAGRRLGREVNPRVVSVESWRSSHDPFLDTIRTRPLVPLLMGFSIPPHQSSGANSSGKPRPSQARRAASTQAVSAGLSRSQGS